MCTFSASKQEIQSQQHFVIMLKKMFITTLHYKCHEDQQISEYMNRQEQSDCNSLIKNRFRYEIATTTNSELNDKVKGYCIEQESDYRVTLHPVELCL